MDNPEVIEEVVVEKVEETAPVVEEEKKEEPKFGVLHQILRNATNPKEDEVVEKVEEPVEKVEKPKSKGLHEMNNDELVGEVKKWMSIGEKRKVELEREKANKVAPDEKYTKFIDGLKTDFFGTYKDLHDEFGLPPIQYLQNQLSTGGDKDTRIQQWQETELVPALEKKFKIEPGTFVQDPTELYKKGTPTEYYRRMTELKEKEIDLISEKEEQKRNEMISSIQDQRNKDLDYISQTFFTDKELFDNKIKEFDEIPEKIAKGELTQEMNPFSIRNVFRGIYFDELADALVKKAVSDVHKQYSSLGLYLPKGKTLPNDVTKMKGSPDSKDESPVSKNNFSMINKTFNRIYI